MLIDDMESTADIVVPFDVMDRIIGQDNAIEKVHVAMMQKRNLLLVGPPGVGKSMIAQALANHLQAPQVQVSVVDNPSNPNKPVIEIMSRQQVERQGQPGASSFGEIVSPMEVPSFVAIRLGFRCSSCGSLSSDEFLTCPNCGSSKYSRLIKSRKQDPVNNMLTDVFEVGSVKPETEVHTSMRRPDGTEDVRVYQRTPEQKIRVLDLEALQKMKDAEQGGKKNVIVPLSRKNFVHMSGASEVELLGDVRHDPYGMHPEIGTPAYLRAVPGAIHEAHEGVLFIDELPHLGELQNYILTAMQEKKFPITGRNPQSGGASIKVEDVPCDFIFVGACNIKDVADILSPLRSRILGNGYEILLETWMEDNSINRSYLAQFVAQEIVKDGKIPHAKHEALIDIMDEAAKRARVIDDQRNCLTLRLRDIGGVIRLAGDLANEEGSRFIGSEQIKIAIEESKPIEYQLQERFGSVWRGIEKDNVINPEYGKMGSSYL